MYKLEIEVQEPYYSFIRSGHKTIEGRLAKERFIVLRPKDLLRINNLEVEVIHTARYPSFRSMLETEGYNKLIPDASDIDYATSVYYRFYTEEDEKKLGVIAIEIKVIRQLN